MALDDDINEAFSRKIELLEGKQKKKGFFSKIKSLFSPRKLLLYTLMTAISTMSVFSCDNETKKTTPPPPNNNPTLDYIADVSVDENQEAVITATGDDPDPQDIPNLTFQVANSGNTNFVQTSPGVFKWTPGYIHSGNYVITITILDGRGGSDYQDVNVEVKDVNRPPVLDPVQSQTVKAGETFYLTLTANDPDPGDNAILEYRVTGGPRAWNKTGNNTFELPTTDADGGNVYFFTAEVDDTKPNGTDTQNFSTTIEEVVIVFQSDRNGNWDLYKMKRDGTDQTQITTSLDDDISPDLSLDRKEIVYLSYIAGVWQVCKIRTDGTNYQQLTTTAGDKMTPKFGPNGVYIYFLLGSGNEDIWRMETNGANPFNVTNAFGRDRYFRIHPNGIDIFFSSNRFPGASDQVAKIKFDGTSFERVTNNPGEWERKVAFKLPNAQSFFYTSTLGAGSPIYEKPTAGGAATNITNDSLHYDEPTCNKNGTYLFCLRSSEIIRIDLGTYVKLALTATADNQGPILTTSDNKVLYVRNIGGTNEEICDMDEDGSNPRNLTNHLANDRNPR